MDANTGKMYRDKEEALKDDVEEEDIVTVTGTPEAVKKVSAAVKQRYNFERAKRRRRMQRNSRKRNRR